METELSEQRVDQVTIRNVEKLALLSFTYVEHCIFGENDQLWMENEKAYEPMAVAFGPYHYGKNN